MIKPRSLTPEQQLSVLTRIWGDREGYVFLPYKINGQLPWHEGRAYKWPKERREVLAQLRGHQHDDLYFSPNMFAKAKRLAINLLDQQRCLYADLDEVDLNSPELRRFRPTILWETSPGRYAAAWILTELLAGTTEDDGPNKRLTYHVANDKSGWDSTQVLRVPGRPNHKPKYVEEHGGPVQGQLISQSGPRWQPDRFHALPEVPKKAKTRERRVSHQATEEAVAKINTEELWAKLRPKCRSTDVKRYMRMTEVPDGMDRSQTIRETCLELAKLGCTAEQIVALIWPKPWNKWYGDPGQLWKEADAAVAEKAVTSDSWKITWADTIGMEATDWLWQEDEDDWLPLGSISLCVGRPDVGKSTLCYWIAAQVTKGKLPGDLQGRPRRVLVCATEDSWKATIKPRLVAAGADTAMVGRVDPKDAEGLEGVMSVVADIPQLKRLIQRYDVALVLMDPLLSVLDQKVDTHKAAEVQAALTPLVGLADETDCAFLGIMHYNKQKGGDLLDRIMGSRSFAGIVRAVVSCERTEDTGLFAFGQIKNNRGRAAKHSHTYELAGKEVGWDSKRDKPITASYVVWGEHDERTVQAIADERDSGKTTSTAVAEAWLKQELHGGPRPRTELIEQAKKDKISESTLNRAKRKLNVQSGQIEGSERNHTEWWLPGGGTRSSSESVDSVGSVDGVGRDERVNTSNPSNPSKGASRRARTRKQTFKQAAENIKRRHPAQEEEVLDEI